MRTSSRLPPPQLDARGDQPLGVLLVHRLPGHAERLGDLRPAPPGAHRALHLGCLQPLGEAAERLHGGEAVRRVGRRRGGDLGHGATVVDKIHTVNLGCLHARMVMRATWSPSSSKAKWLGPLNPLPPTWALTTTSPSRRSTPVTSS